MRIGIVSTQNNGKTTLVEAFKKFWPKYISPTATYRDIIKEKNLSINQNSNLETQTILRDSLVDQAINNASITHRIDDCTILDNLVYTLWLGGKDKIDDVQFITDSINICRETLKLYDIIFWLPLNPDIIIEGGKADRDIDPSFREEIDAIFQAVYEGYVEQDGIVFDVKDQPPMIPLQGDLDEKLNIIREYLNEEGDLIETEKSIFQTLEDTYDQVSLEKELLRK